MPKKRFFNDATGLSESSECQGFVKRIEAGIASRQTGGWKNRVFKRTACFLGGQGNLTCDLWPELEKMGR